MFKILSKLKIFVITILVGMVFAVNVGYTFAVDTNASKVTLGIEADSRVSEGVENSYTYLNDVVVNNSTTEIPIGYTLGTVQRDINFDYSFSEPTDVAIKYELKYTDGTEPSNVILNVVNRDEYIWDQETVLMENYTNSYNASSASGTLYYLNTLSGVGNQKLFSGVTFLTGNNQIESYKATEAITLGYSEYSVDEVLTTVDYQYTQLEMARYWDVYTTNSIGQPIKYICKTSYTMGGVTIPSGVTMTATNYNSYIDGGAGVYSTAYVVSTEFSIEDGLTTTTYSLGDVLSLEDVNKLSLEVRSNINLTCTRTSAFWAPRYKCVTECTVGDTTYTAGNIITVAKYESLVATDSSCATSFESCYECETAYSIQAQENIISSGNTIDAGDVITAEEYQLLFAKEQSKFEVNEYKTFENKNLQIEIKVYTKVASQETDAIKLAEYYNEETHYFKNLKRSSDGKAFKYWTQYKSESLTENSFMIYNAHAKYENGIPYATNFAYGKDLTTTLADDEYKSNLVSSYIYKVGTNDQGDPALYFYSYAGGNKYNAGVGVYYLTTSKVKLTVRASISWYNSNGVKISSMPINNVKLKYAGTDGVEFSKDIDAGKHGYLNILEYIQTTTEGSLFDMTGYSLVVSSVAVVATALGDDVSVTEDFKDVSVLDSTAYNPLLYSYYHDLGSSTFKSFNITISNNTDKAIMIPNVVLSPSFTAYNGSTAISTSGGDYVYGEAKTIMPTFSTDSLSQSSSTITQPHFAYDAVMWYCYVSGSDYVFAPKSINIDEDKGYLAPHTSITVISGIVTPSAKDGEGNINIDWSIPATTIDQTGGSYYADYWFEVDARLESNSVTNETTFAATEEYRSAEIITYLDSTKIDTTDGVVKTAYIGLRNNTLQKITAIEYTGTLLQNNSTDVSYGVSSYLSEAATKTDNVFTVSSSSIALMPGESIILCKLDINPDQEKVYLSKSTVKCTLAEGQASSSGVYFKRDYASGNLSIINGGTDANLQVAIDGVSNTDLVGGATKWNDSCQYIMQDTKDAEGNAKTPSLAVFKQNQIINLLKDYYTKIESISCTTWSVPTN